MKTFRQYLKEEATPTDEAANTEEAIIQLFKDNEKVDDNMVHALSDKLGIDTHVFEAMIYKLLSDFFHAGKSMNFTGNYDSNELEMGKKVEMEHTTNPLIAERIAKDHLSEIQDYYTRLAKMEAEAGIKESMKEGLEDPLFKVGDKVHVKDYSGAIGDFDGIIKSVTGDNYGPSYRIYHIYDINKGVTRRVVPHRAKITKIN